MRLEGKVAVVTGAAQGLGLAIALALAREGCDVAGFDIQRERMEEVAERIRGLRKRALALEVDVRDFQAVQRAMGQVYETLGRVDILVNNAGRGQRELLADITEAIWDDQIAENLKSVFNCCKAVVLRMIEQQSGRIINISSVAALRGSGLLGKSAYAAAKGGIISFSKSLARELAPYGICVNCITPGFHLTTRVRERASPEDWDHCLRQIPMGRIGQPEELAEAVVFLASPGAAYITGIVLACDGGYSMH